MNSTSRNVPTSSATYADCRRSSNVAPFPRRSEFRGFDLRPSIGRFSTAGPADLAYPPSIAPAAAASIYLARHGQTAYNHEGRFQGQQAIPLDDTGRAQAHELAERAVSYDFRALWCSPLLRARETADIVAARIGLEPKEDMRLMETDAGDWTDRSFEDVRAEAQVLFDSFVAAEPDFAFPGGESFAQQDKRVLAALADIELGVLPALVVCHGMVIRAALSGRTGHPLAEFKRVSNGALIPLDPEVARRDGLDEGGSGRATLAS